MDGGQGTNKIIFSGITKRHRLRKMVGGRVGRRMPGPRLVWVCLGWDIRRLFSPTSGILSNWGLSNVMPLRTRWKRETDL